MVYFVLDLIHLIKCSAKLWISYLEYKALEAPGGSHFLRDIKVNSNVFAKMSKTTNNRLKSS